MNHEVGRVSPSAPTPTVANGAMRTSRPTDPAGSWSQCVVAKPWRLSMNLPSPGLRPPSPLLGRGEGRVRSEEHTSELQSRLHLVCRLLLEKKNKQSNTYDYST